MHRRRKSAKVKGIVQRARSALTGGPAGGADQTDGDLEARVAIAGQGLRCIAEQARTSMMAPSSHSDMPALVSLGHAEPAWDRVRDRLRHLAHA